MEVYSISSTPEYTPHISLLSSFYLPRVHDPTTGPTISTPYDVVVAPVSHYDFRSARNALIHVTLSDHNFFILLSALRTSDAACPVDPQTKRRAHQWADWGPPSSRMVCHYLSNLVICGYRVILPNQIWDFNPTVPHTETKASTCSPTGRGIFINAVETKLPFNMARIDPSITPTWTSFMSLIEYKDGPKVCRSHQVLLGRRSHEVLSTDITSRSRTRGNCGCNFLMTPNLVTTMSPGIT